MKINNTVNVYNPNNQKYNSNPIRKNYLSNSGDTVTFSGKNEPAEPESFGQKFLNFAKKPLTKFYVSKEDVQKAKDGFSAYQYSSMFINSALRQNPDVKSAAKDLRRMSKTFSDGKGTEAFFVERGFDILSERLQEDTTVYRYIYSSEDYKVDWKKGDKITEKGFMSTTSDKRDESYPKTYVETMLKYYNQDHENGQFYTMEITVPKGTRVVRGDERMHEVLLKYGSTFKVDDFNSETNRIKCTII